MAILIFQPSITIVLVRHARVICGGDEKVDGRECASVPIHGANSDVLGRILDRVLSSIPRKQIGMLQ